MENNITEETTLKKVLEQDGAKDILAKYSVPCLACPMAKYEMETLSLGQICSFYNIDKIKLLKELNKIK